MPRTSYSNDSPVDGPFDIAARRFNTVLLSGILAPFSSYQ